MGFSTIEERYPLSLTARVTDADGTSPVVILPTDIRPYRVDGIICSTTSATQRYVDIILNGESVNAQMGSRSIPALSGTGSAAPQSILAGMFAPFSAGFVITPGCSVSMRMETALGAGETMDFAITGGYF